MRRLGGELGKVIPSRLRAPSARQACAVTLMVLGCGLTLGCAPASSTSGTARVTPAAVPTATPLPCPSPTASTSAVEQQLASAVASAVGQDAHCLDAAYSAQDHTATINITVPWPIAATPPDIAATHERTMAVTFRAQRALWTSGVPLSAATVIVLGPTLDSDAFVATAAYASTTLTASTAAKFSWTSLSADMAWNQYDQAYLRPDYDNNDNVVRH